MSMSACLSRSVNSMPLPVEHVPSAITRDPDTRLRRLRAVSTRITGPLGYKRFLLASSLRTLFSRERALACSELAPLVVRIFVLLPANAAFVFSDVFEVEHACNRASPIRQAKHVQLSTIKFRAARCIILYSFTEAPRLLVPTIMTGMPAYALLYRSAISGFSRDMQPSVQSELRRPPP